MSENRRAAPPRLARLALVAALLAGCAAAPPSPPAPAIAVALLPVWNPPGRSAIVGEFTFDRWLRPARDGVGALLDDAVRAALAARGIAVRSAPAPDGRAPETLRAATDAAAALPGEAPVLYLRVMKWEASHPSAPAYVDADVDAVLLAAGSGRVLWSARGPDTPVATRGAASLDDGYARAAAAVATWLVGDWRPAAR